MLHRSIIAVCLLLSACSSSHFTPSTQGKKLIAYGQDYPNPAYCRAHIVEMEQRPFDGVVIAASRDREPKLAGDSMGYSAWGHTRYNFADYTHCIDDLKATPFKRFTDNFIQVESMPGDVDWYSDKDFETVCDNFAILARIAKQGGCKGLEFDPEEYSAEHIWTWTAWPEARKKVHSEDDTIAMVRERGKQLMCAINAEFPDVRILCLFGPSFTYSRLQTNNHRYRLLAPFLEGMASVATPGTQIIDGFEQSYPYRAAISFIEGRKTQLECRSLFENKSDFDRAFRVGFGLWMDENSGQLGWHPNEPDKNHFQPDTWQSAVHYALAYSDEYVWIWHERYNLWTGKDLPMDYLIAQEAGRKAPGRIAPAGPGKVARPPRAVAIQGHDDASTFADLLASHDLLYSFPTTGWRIHFGEDFKWYEVINPDTVLRIKPIEIGKFWEEQGYDYDGFAWYRTSFNIPPVPDGKRITLAVGAADESAWVYLNGKLVCEHDLGEGGWDQRFTCDITKQLRPGENQLTIRVLDRVGPGGLWKGIKIFTSK